MDLLTGILTICSVELLARKRWHGWLLGLLNQPCWLWVIYSKGAWGLLPLTLWLTVRYTFALIRWRREAREV